MGKKQWDCTKFLWSAGRSQEINMGIDLKSKQKGIYQSQVSSFHLNMIAAVLQYVILNPPGNFIFSMEY